MELTSGLHTILMIVLLLGVYFVITLMMKWINGDLTPISVEEIEKTEIDIFDDLNNVIGKKVMVKLKCTYNNGVVKYKIKKYKI